MNLWEAVKGVPITEVAQDLDVKIVSDKGNYVVALCPFHEDHLGQGGKPNLSLLKAKNSYKCFNCGAHGTVIDFWANLTKVTPEAAVHAMAEKYHIQAPEEPPKKKQPSKPKKKAKAGEVWDQDRIEKASAELFQPENENHLQNFCKIRHVSPEYVKEKKIGLAWVPGIKLAYTIPAFDSDGKILSIRTHSRASRKDKRFIAGHTSKFLYDLTSYDPNGEELWIVEGEGDAWTLEFGLKKNVISSFAGAATLPKIIAEQKEKLGDLSKKTRIRPVPRQRLFRPGLHGVDPILPPKSRERLCRGVASELRAQGGHLLLVQHPAAVGRGVRVDHQAVQLGGRQHLHQEAD